MSNRVLKFVAICAFPIMFSASCKTSIVSDFFPITNVNLTADRSFSIDMDSVILEGLEAPTKRQIAGGYFKFSFKVKPSSNKLYYKLYYQNEDYKFPEELNDELNPLAEENFYGSWGYTDVGFKEIPAGSEIIEDQFKICGNPRNEQIYFGDNMSSYKIEEEEVKLTMASIQSQPEWFASIEAKAIQNKMPIEQQLELDAIYMLGQNRDSGDENHRWKRNIRMGSYSTLLVVCTEEDLQKIPEHIRNITKQKENKYINPYYYFLYGEGANLGNTEVILNENSIRLKSKIDVNKGIFINKAEKQNHQEYTHFNSTCGDSDSLFSSAHIEQFFHTEIRDFKMKTIPVIADVLKNEYTADDYKQSEKNYTDSQMMDDYIRSSNCPCKTVRINAAEQALEIFNPGSTDLTTARKENVGIKTRIGYTYGKFTAKIKFPSQLNSTNVWTGLTNAFWMLFQDKQSWNYRRESKSGYAQKGVYSPDAPRNPTTYYSEIDFEIVKTSKFWPAGVYHSLFPPTEDAQQNSDIIVTSTNHDLSSSDPVRFGEGFCPTTYNGETFQPFRWLPWHQAITTRTAVKNEDLYSGPFYYYQIEWRPNEIIWRIGPSKDQLKVVGYMNDEITMIPNNQMVMIVTQEYHLTDWWPPMPFKQEYIPFLKNDLIGKIYEFEIE